VGNDSALVTRLLDHAQLRVPAIPQWLRDDLALAAETIIELRRQVSQKPGPPTVCTYCDGTGENEDMRDGPDFPATEVCLRCGGSGKPAAGSPP
jgi:hypothetical protein